MSDDLGDTLSIVLDSLSEGMVFSSLHQNTVRPGVWVASVMVPASTPCSCCGHVQTSFHFTTGDGPDPVTALRNLYDILRKVSISA